MTARERLPELLNGLLSLRVGSHIVMEDFAGAQFHDHQWIQRAERSSDHNKEIACHDDLGQNLPLFSLPSWSKDHGELLRWIQPSRARPSYSACPPADISTSLRENGHNYTRQII